MSRRRTYKRASRNDLTMWSWVLGIFSVYYVAASLPEWVTIAVMAVVAIGVILYLYFLYEKQNAYRASMLRLTTDDIDQMSGIEFENYAEVLFQNLGYRIRKTAVTGDFGVDLIISKDGIKTAVQCKRYAGTIGVPAIQQAHTGMVYYGCDRSLVITNSTFTKSANILAQSNKCILVDRTILAGMLRGIDPITNKTVVMRETA